MYEKSIICLANSKKPPSGRCIAGKEFNGEWVRPVSARPGREVSERERQYENGQKVQLLDIVSVPLESHSPLTFQVENHVLCRKYYWEKEGVADWEQVTNLLDDYDHNFWMPAESTRYGLNDKIHELEAVGVRTSLKLISLPAIEIIVHREAGYKGSPGRRRVRARFVYEGIQYIFSVTDPVIESQYLEYEDGVYVINEVIVCISLAEVWNEYAFRLVAAIITRDRCCN